MRLLHWNIHMWRDVEGEDNKDAVADLIGRVTPDVVSLVEVDEPWGRPDGVRWLASELGYQWVFVPAFEYRGEGGFGNALLARLPIRSVQQWQLLSPRLYTNDEPSEPRAVLIAEVNEDPGWWIGSTHFPRSNPTMRNEASARLLQLLERLDTPCVLCGDFNQPPTAWLSPSMVVAPNPGVATHPASGATEAIDYFVVRGATAKAEVIDSDASDHLPVVVEVAPLNEA